MSVLPEPDLPQKSQRAGSFGRCSAAGCFVCVFLMPFSGWIFISQSFIEETLSLNKMGFATSDAGQSTWQHRLGSAVTTGIGVAGGVKTAIDVGKAIWGVARYVAPLIV